MKNKSVGFLIIGIALVMAVMVLLFNGLIKKNIGLTCSHGPTCEMYTDLAVQTWISLAIVAVIVIIGFFLIFSKPEEKIVIRKLKEKRKKLSLDGLDKDEKRIIKLLQEENGGMFQRTLMEKLELGKVKVTRLLDRLESKELTERKRRGMNNIVILRH